MKNKTLEKLGFWTAVLTAVFSLAYLISEITFTFLAETSNTLALSLKMTPSLFLAPSFVVLMVSIYFRTPEERRIWSMAGLSMAVIYAVLVSIVYYVQLGVVFPLTDTPRVQDISLLIFEPGSLMFAIDILGYGFMSLATLFAAFSFTGKGLKAWIRWLFFINGLLVIPIMLQIYWPWLFYLASIWGVTFPVPAILIARLFKRQQLPNTLQEPQTV